MTELLTDASALRIPVPTRPRAIVSDIDGVLADGSHRFEPIAEAHARGERPDWDSYISRAADDDIIPAGRVVCDIAIAANIMVLLLTNRLERERAVTEAWLKKHRVRHHILFMRGEQDSYTEYKVMEMRYLTSAYEVQLILEDDQRLCDIYGEFFDIPVLRVASPWSHVRFPVEHQS